MILKENNLKKYMFEIDKNVLLFEFFILNKIYGNFFLLVFLFIFNVSLSCYCFKCL